jgi:hypothetical protein
MYDFNVTMKVTSLYEVIGTKTVTKHDQREGAYESNVEVNGRGTSLDEVAQWIRENPDVEVKQVVELKDVTAIAKNKARGIGG